MSIDRFHKAKEQLSRCHFLCIVALLLASSALNAADEKPPNYIDHIKPILRQHCLKCHGDDKQEADINLQAFAALLRGGKHVARSAVRIGPHWQVPATPF